MPIKTNAPKAASTDLAPRLWVNRYANYLYSYACARLNDRELARDLVQETFLAALERLEKFNRHSSEKAWLTAILKSKIFDITAKRPITTTYSIKLLFITIKSIKLCLTKRRSPC